MKKRRRGSGEEYDILDDFVQPAGMGQLFTGFMRRQMELGTDMLRRRPSSIRYAGVPGFEQYHLDYSGRIKGHEVLAKYISIKEVYMLELHFFGAGSFDNFLMRTPQLRSTYKVIGRELLAFEHLGQLGGFEANAHILRELPNSPQALASATGTAVFDRGTTQQGDRVQKISNMRVGQEEFDTLGRFLIGRTIQEAMLGDDA